MMHRIQTPTPGRIVLYAPDKEAGAVMSTMDPDIHQSDLQVRRYRNARKRQRGWA
jgi:hypothetical protein